MTVEDDIVAYLTMFEHLMSAYEVKRECWAFKLFKLAANLVGKAQQAYAALSVEDASSYNTLKEARYDITEESCGQRFRTTKKKSRVEQRDRGKATLKWLKSCKNPAEVCDRIVMEQFLSM